MEGEERRLREEAPGAMSSSRRKEKQEEEDMAIQSLLKSYSEVGHEKKAVGRGARGEGGNHRGPLDQNRYPPNNGGPMDTKFKAEWSRGLKLSENRPWQQDALVAGETNGNRFVKNDRRLFSESLEREAQNKREILDSQETDQRPTEKLEAKANSIKLFTPRIESKRKTVRKILPAEEGLPQPSSFKVDLGNFDPEAYLASQRAKESKNVMQRFQFNEKVSHATPYNRSLKDSRSFRYIDCKL